MNILEERLEGNKKIVIYTKDGINVSHIVEESVDANGNDYTPEETKETSFQQRILAETEYQTALLEMLLLGGE